jgi:hypothetical protein
VSTAAYALLGPAAEFRRPGLVTGACAIASGLLAGAGLAFGLEAAAASIAAALIALLVLRRPLAGAYLLIGVVPIVSGLRRDLPVPGLRLSEVVVTAIAALLLLTVETRRSRPWTLFDWMALAYAVGTLALGGFDLLDRGAPLTATSAGTLIGPFQFLLLYRAVLVVVRTDEERRRALALLLWASVPVSLVTLLQYADIGAVTAALHSVTGAQELVAHADEAHLGERMTGVFPHWQMLAGYLFAIVAICSAALLTRERPPMPRGALAAIALLALAAMVATGTFVTVIGIVAAALILGAWYGRVGRVVAALGGAALAAVFAFGPLIEERVNYTFVVAPGADRSWFMPQSVAYRIDLWSDQLLPAIAGRLLTGYGPDLPPGLSFEFTESMYLTLLFRGGIPLLLIYIGLMLALSGVALRAARSTEGLTALLGRALFAIIALLALLHLLEPYFVTTGLPHLVWILAALAVSALYSDQGAHGRSGGGSAHAR